MVTDKSPHHDAPLPKSARLALNRCNLPARILGALSFQRHPAPLTIDGVQELHADLFRRLRALDSPRARAEQFRDYMSVHFCLESLEDAGLDEQNDAHRGRADYLRLLRGWHFDAEGREAAVLKGWVESRFGLLTRYHGGPIDDANGEHYRRFIDERARGLYNTNALEAQLDLLYAFAQEELQRRHPQCEHLTLYRGVNGIDRHELVEKLDARRSVLLLNNLNAFSDDEERAGEFGDTILSVQVPLCKVFTFHGLLPGRLQGESEYLVLGGLYEVQRL